MPIFSNVFTSTSYFFADIQANSKKIKRTCKPTHNIDSIGQTSMTEKQRTAKNTYKKLAVQWLNELLYFVSSSLVVDSFVLRNRQLFEAATVTSNPKITTVQR
jgi:hypothetical protein